MPLTYDDLDTLLGIRQRVDVPCPLCGPDCTSERGRQKPVLRIWSADVAHTYCCARCGAKGYARTDGPSSTTRAPRRPPRSPDPCQRSDAERTAYAMSLWREGRDIRGTLVERYLRSRGLDVAEDLTHVLRFHPRLRYDQQFVAGMLALMRDVVTGEARAVHRTFLDPAGNKIDRRMYGPAKGAAIMIDAPENVTTGLHIGEGIESVLSGRQLDFRPAWALGSAGAVATFPVRAGIEALTVFSENDRASEDAAGAVCARYCDAGAEAFVFAPFNGDLNDVIRRVA